MTDATLVLDAPAWLAALGGVLIIRWLHRFHDASRILRIPALFLWREHTADPIAGQMRTRPDRIWFLRAATFALIVVALAGPDLVDQRTSTLRVWIDDSASMYAYRHGQTRLDRALDEVGRAVASLPEPGPAIEYRSLSNPAVVHADIDAARAALAEPGDDWRSLPPALPAVADPSVHWLVTDGASEETANLAARMQRVIHVGEETENVGVQAIGARRTAGGSGTGGIQATVTIQNHGERIARRSLVVSYGGKQTIRRFDELTIAPGERRNLVVSLSSDDQVIHASLTEPDALADDDNLFLALDPLVPLNVSIAHAGDCPRTLTAALSTHPGLRPTTASADIRVDCAPGRGVPLARTVRIHSSQPTTELPSDAVAIWHAEPRFVLYGPWLRSPPAVPTGADRVLLGAGARPLVTADPDVAGSIDVWLDLAHPHLATRPELPLLVDALFTYVVGRDLLDPAPRATRPAFASVIIPRQLTAEAPSATSGNRLPAASPGSSTTLTRLLLAAALVLIAIDLILLHATIGITCWSALPRMGACLLLALALWDPDLPGGRPARDVVLVVDASDSMASSSRDDASRDAAADVSRLAPASRLAVVRFGANAVVERTLTPIGLQQAPSTRYVDPGGSNVAAGLTAALGLIDPGQPSDLILVTDGIENLGTASVALERARNAGVSVSVSVVESVQKPLRVEHVVAPERARADQPVWVAATLTSRSDQRVRVALAVDDRVRTARDVALPAGRPRAVALPFGRLSAGAHEWHLDVAAVPGSDGSAAGSSTPERLTRTEAAYINVTGPPLAAVVSERASGVARALRDNGWLVADVGADTAARMARDPDETAGPDFAGRLGVLILDDVSATRLTEGEWRAVTHAVRTDGLGVIVSGGANSFGAGGYRGSVLEAALPVLSEPRRPRPALAVEFVVDTSGSMAAVMPVAVSAISETARALGARDTVGVVGFDTQARELLPLTDRAALEQLITAGALRPSGGTRLLPALALAIGALERSPIHKRIVVLLTDGELPEESTAGVERRMRDADISLITLAVGSAGASLQGMVERVDGRLFDVVAQSRLPALTRRSVEAELRPYLRERATVVPDQRLPFDVPQVWPPVDGYATTRSRDGAVVYLRSDRGDPILAAWPVGAGFVAALPGGIPDRWLREMPEFVPRLASWVSSRDGSAGLQLRLTRAPGVVRIGADNGAAGDTPRGRLVHRDGTEVPLEFDVQAPGRAVATVVSDRPGPMTANVRLGAESVTHRFAGGKQFESGRESRVDDWLRAGLVERWPDGRPSTYPGAPRSLAQLASSIAPLLLLAGLLRERRSDLARRLWRTPIEIGWRVFGGGHPPHVRTRRRASALR